MLEQRILGAQAKGDCALSESCVAALPSFTRVGIGQFAVSFLSEQFLGHADRRVFGGFFGDRPPAEIFAEPWEGPDVAGPQLAQGVLAKLELQRRERSYDHIDATRLRARPFIPSDLATDPSVIRRATLRMAAFLYLIASLHAVFSIVERIQVSSTRVRRDDVTIFTPLYLSCVVELITAFGDRLTDRMLHLKSRWRLLNRRPLIARALVGTQAVVCLHGSHPPDCALRRRLGTRKLSGPALDPA